MLTEQGFVAQPGEFEAGKYAITRLGVNLLEEIVGLSDDGSSLEEEASKILDKAIDERIPPPRPGTEDAGKS